MRSIMMAAIMALYVGGQALGANTVAIEASVGGDNHADVWENDGFLIPSPYSGGTTSDGSVLDRGVDGNVLSWAATATMTGDLGDTSNGIANIVIDVELYSNAVDPGNIVNIGLGNADCADGVPGFCSTINDGLVDPNGRPTEPVEGAAFAVSLEANPTLGLGPVGTLTDSIGNSGPGLDYATFPSTSGFPAGSTAGTGELVGMGAGYSSYTITDGGFSTGNMAGVGCVGASVGATTCAGGNSIPLGNGPFFEGQINTGGLPDGTYVLRVTSTVAANNILEPSFNPLNYGAGAVNSFALASTAVSEDTISFVLTGGPLGANLVSAYSRKTHGGSVDYDRQLYPTHAGTATAGVESRKDGITRLVLNFDGPLALTCGDLVVSNKTCAGTADLGGNSWEVTLTGLTPNTCTSVTVNAAIGAPVVYGLNVYGDVDAGGSVTIVDLSSIKSNVAGGTLGVVDGTNFTQDLDLSNTLNIIDMSQAKSNLTGFVTCP